METPKIYRIVKEGILEVIRYQTLTGEKEQEILTKWKDMGMADAIRGEITIMPKIHGGIASIELKVYTLDWNAKPRKMDTVAAVSQVFIETNGIKAQPEPETAKPDQVVKTPSNEKYHKTPWYREKLAEILSTCRITGEEPTSEFIYDKISKLVDKYALPGDYVILSKKQPRWKRNFSVVKSEMREQFDMVMKEIHSKVK